MKAKVGSASRKLVLIKLADNANDAGFCHPSYKHISDHCEMTKRSVMAHIARLEKEGFLAKTSRKTPKGSTSNQYKLTILGGENISPPPSEKYDTPPVKIFHPPSENISPPPSENISPRTSHSFEPVIEPVIEPSGELVKTAFNEMTLLKRILKITPKRKAAIDKLKVDLQSMDSWRAFFSKVNDSDFLCGRKKDSDWEASFDWIINSSNALKILEGNYDNKKKAADRHVEYIPPEQRGAGGLIIDAVGVEL